MFKRPEAFCAGVWETLALEISNKRLHLRWLEGTAGAGMKWLHAYFQKKIPRRSVLGKEPFVAHSSTSGFLKPAQIEPFVAYFQRQCFPHASAIGAVCCSFSASVSLGGFVSTPQACPRPPLLWPSQNGARQGYQPCTELGFTIEIYDC